MLLSEDNYIVMPIYIIHALSKTITVSTQTEYWPPIANVNWYSCMLFQRAFCQSCLAKLCQWRALNQCFWSCCNNPPYCSTFPVHPHANLQGCQVEAIKMSEILLARKIKMSACMRSDTYNYILATWDCMSLY